MNAGRYSCCCWRDPGWGDRSESQWQEDSASEEEDLKGHGSREAREGLLQPPEGRGRPPPPGCLWGQEDTFQM